MTQNMVKYHQQVGSKQKVQCEFCDDGIDSYYNATKDEHYTPKYSKYHDIDYDEEIRKAEKLVTP